MPTKKIGIIGNGRYGSFWKNYFEKKGCEVRTSDIGTSPGNEEVARWAEVVLIAVTLMETVKVVESLIPLLRPEQLLVDIASTKTNSETATLRTPCEVIALHPFCAPPVRRGTFKGQTIFVHFARVAKWSDWARVFLRETEAAIEEITPEQHDRERTIDQVLEHMCTNLKVAVMRRLGVSASKLFRVASPVYKLTAVQMARMYSQSPELYGGIPMSNPFSLKTLRIFGEELGRYIALVEQANMPGYRAEFLANVSHIGPKDILESFVLSEELIGFMADLSEEHSLLITLASDEPGILERVGRFFKDAEINLTAFHSRRFEGRTEFFIGFDRDTMKPEVLEVTARLKRELGAKVGELRAIVL